MLTQADTLKKIWDIIMKPEAQWDCGYVDEIATLAKYGYNLISQILKVGQFWVDFYNTCKKIRTLDSWLILE